MTAENERSGPAVVVVGCFQNGKSTLINCLLDDNVAQTGWGNPRTHLSTRYTWGEIQTATLFPKDPAAPLEELPLHRFLERMNGNDLQGFERAEVTLRKPILRDFDIIDTPGFNANVKDEERALASMKEADYLLFVLSNEKGMSESEQLLLTTIAFLKIPYILLLNCIAFDRWNPASPENDRIREHIHAISQRHNHPPESVDGRTPVWPCNLLWFRYAAGRSSELGEDLKKVERRIRRYFELEEEPVPDLKNLAAKSNFLPIRQFFQTRSWRPLMKPRIPSNDARSEQSVRSSSVTLCSLK